MNIAFLTRNKDKGIISIINQKLNWNKARLDCFWLIIVGIMQARSSSLWKISCYGADKKTKRDSHYRRIQRFFSSFSFDYNQIGRLIFGFLPKNQCFDLAIDRTNWKFGKEHINILYVGAVYSGVIYPLVWLVLPKKSKRGNSSTRHRKALILRLLKIIPSQQIGTLLGDREFVGRQWIEFLHEQNINFVMRVRNSEIMKVWHKSYTSLKIKKMAGEILPDKGTMDVSPEGMIWDLKLKITLYRMENKKGEIVALASNCLEGTEALEDYRLRWSIECFFSHLKLKGFDMESTHLQKRTRIKKLCALLAVAFVIAHKTGQILEHKKICSLYIRKHKKPGKSIFRIGLDWIQECFTCFRFKIPRLDKLWQNLAQSLNLNLIFQKNVV